MILSLQFRALARFAVVWAIPWAGAGALLALLRWIAAPSGFSLGEALALHTTAFGALGLISGLDVGLILARAERGRRVDQLVPRRVALWGLLGGAAPAVLFALLGWAFGAPATVWAPLAGLGVVSAVISAGLATSVVTAAKPREPLSPPKEAETFRATYQAFAAGKGARICGSPFAAEMRSVRAPHLTLVPIGGHSDGRTAIES